MTTEPFVLANVLCLYRRENDPDSLKIAIKKEMNAQLKVIYKLVQGISAYDVSELVRWYGYEVDLY